MTGDVSNYGLYPTLSEVPCHFYLCTKTGFLYRV